MALPFDSRGKGCKQLEAARSVLQSEDFGRMSAFRVRGVVLFGLVAIFWAKDREGAVVFAGFSGGEGGSVMG